MSDKTREDFEEEYPVPTGVYWCELHNEYLWSDYFWSDEASRQQRKFEIWLAAKEKYEPRWIPVSERLPEPFTHVGLLDMRGFQNCPDQMQGADHIKDIGYYSLSPSLDQGTWSIRGERSVLVDAYTHWMKLPPAPSTQGGGG